MATRNDQNKPLTLLQLQGDVWDIAKKTSRDTISNTFATKSIVEND